MPTNVFSHLLGTLPSILSAAFPYLDISDEIVLGLAALVTLLGIWLCWLASEHRMSIEEDAKDGNLTDEEARRRINQLSWSGPAIVIAGVAMIALTLLP
jgi:hypothetical protein